MENEQGIKLLRQRPNAPKAPIQCPWCDHRPAPPGRLSQHIKSVHPLQWKGNIYESLPADFDYGNGPLAPEIRATLIQYSRYSRASWKKRGPYYKPRKLKSTAAVRRGRLGGLARAARAKARAELEAAQTNGALIPHFDRSIKYCPHCGWNLDATAKAQAFVDGRAE